MAAAKPWMKWYPRDWRADEKLRLCSLAARGLWIEMLAVMHSSERYGRLLIAGQSPSNAQLGLLVGASEAEVETLVAELESAHVFSRDANSIIYSRRMISDEKTSEKARKVGKKGGNPTLCKQKGNPPQDNPSDIPRDKAGDKPRGQRPESREVSKQPSTTSENRAIPADVRSVLETGGFISPPPDLSLLSEWYRAGATLEQDVLPTMRRLRANADRAPFRLKFFDAAIREKLAEDTAEIERMRRSSERYRREEQASTGGPE